MLTDPAPNRPLSLAELTRPDYAAVIARMEQLLAEHRGCYLHPGKRWEYPWALDRAELRAPCRVLDAGCGASIFPHYLAAEGHEVHAVDLHPPAGGAPRLHYLRAALTALPFAGGAFDAVFCISVIEHLGHAGARAALAELRRVVRPGGRVLLTTDYYEEAGAELWYEGPGERFRVDWGFFDAELIGSQLLRAPGLHPDGPVDLRVDWETVKPAMRAFHGYPYTSFGVALVRD